MGSKSDEVDPADTKLMSEIDELVGDERFVDAVDRLAAVPPESWAPDLDVRLLELRHAATRNYAAGSGRATWPPPDRDPFPAVVDRLPEIEAVDLDASTLGGAVIHHGCLVVRGLFTCEQVARTVESIDRATAQRDGCAPAGGEVDDRVWFRPFPLDEAKAGVRRRVNGNGGTWLADSPAATGQVLGDLRSAGVIDLITEHLGERPFFSLQKSTLRRSPPTFSITGWHQDGSFLGPDVRTMNVWIALTRCGGDHPAPGMEVVPKRVDELLPTDGTGPVSIPWERVQAAAAATPVVHPEFGPGDAMFFDERFLHRTYLTPHMTEDRYALETWFFAPSRFSSGYVPFLV